MGNLSLHTSVRSGARRWLPHIFLGMIALLALSGEAVLLSQQKAANALPGFGGPFDLTGTNGKRMTQADLLSKPTVWFFGYTSCPDVCPTTLSTLTNVMKKMGRLADKLNVVFVSVDPEHDTPVAMKQYLSAFDSRILGLTGTDAEVAKMAKAYHVVYRREETGDGTYVIYHSAIMLLLDADGAFAGTIPYDDADNIVQAKLTALANSAHAASTVAARNDR